jgi:uncharacterized protein with HEPN domain
LGAVEKIERYVSGMDHDAFVRDEKTIDSVVRNLEIIGEAPPLAGRFQETVPRDQVATNHWSQTSDRSRLFHIDVGIVWQIIQTDLPVSNPGYRQPVNFDTKNLRLSYEDYLQLKVVLEPPFCRHPLSSRAASG